MKGLTEDMSIAVEPSKKKQYDREPLHIKTPLPTRWGDCYHYALDHLLVRIPHVPASTELYEISKTETGRHLNSIQKDLKRRMAKEHNYRLDHMESRPETTTAVPSPQADVSLMDMQSDPIMTVRIPHDINLLTDVLDPDEFIQQQWYLAQM
jgi:hypothetical protein